MKSIILIPTFNPGKQLYDIIKMLYSLNLFIIIVNDGSYEEDSLSVLNEIKENFEKVLILDHEKNLGKGQALKTGFKKIINTFKEFERVITVDSDGQHEFNDIIKFLYLPKENDKAIFIGKRYFDKEIPKKSLIGNNITAYIFKLLFDVKISDTQNGLRSILIQHLPLLINLNGSRFEYETNVFIYFIKNKLGIKEIEITTIYLDNNKKTNFKVIKDSYLIYKSIFINFFLK